MKIGDSSRLRTCATRCLFKPIALVVSACVALGASAADLPRNTSGVVASSSLAPAIETARQSARKLHENTKAPGMSVAVSVAGEIVWSEAFGHADREKQTPATRQTLFRIGSVSKLLTVAALARLYEQGRLELDAPVSKYLAGYPDLEGRITPRCLAGHLAGIRHYAGMAEFLSTRHCENVGQAIDAFRNDPLLHEPGSKYYYSSHGYVLLSGVIEAAAGVPFPTAVETLVLRPLSLSSTRLDGSGEAPPERSADYSLSEGTVVVARSMDLSCRAAAGGYLSTADDLVRLTAAHAGGSFLKPETEKLLFTSQRLADGKETRVGIGWRVAQDDQGRAFVHHGGNIVGGRAFVLLYPVSRTAIAVCTNLGDAPFAEKEVLAIVAPFLSGRTTP